MQKAVLVIPIFQKTLGVRLSTIKGIKLDLFC